MQNQAKGLTIEIKENFDDASAAYFEKKQL
jgi:hypothetical protein